MSYRDPYAEQHGNAYQGRHEFNPYSSQQAYPSYGQAGPYNYATPYQDTPMDQETSVNTRTKDANQMNEFDRREFTTKEAPTDIKEFRRNYQGNMWTKGGKGRCICRFICCTLLIVLFLFISIILALALWIKPPSITVGSAMVTSTNSFLRSEGIAVPLSVNISVNNPNYFSVNLHQFKAEFSYPKGNVPVGSGVLNNIVFESNSEKNLTFSFNIDYKFADDPSLQALFDIAQKCGVTSGQKSNLNFDYRFTIELQILVANIKPSVSNTISIPCPLSQADIEKIKTMVPGFT